MKKRSESMMIFQVWEVGCRGETFLQTKHRFSGAWGGLPHLLATGGSPGAVQRPASAGILVGLTSPLVGKAEIFFHRISHIH
ncbi:MAG: hypothetical protein EOM73_16045 [Bacteroidia bacterium]|nr:hypothetical protein [Bacteroidia bacterium]